MPGECIHAEILIKEVDEFEIAFYINNVILISYWLSHVSRARRSQDFRCASRESATTFPPSFQRAFRPTSYSTTVMARETPIPKRCFLSEMAPEIMEMIIGNVSFVDFIELPAVSSWLKVLPPLPPR
jgi:hypothetical protein